MCIAAIIGASIGIFGTYFSNKKLQRQSQHWHEHRHKVTSTEKYIDELIESATAYWIQGINKENHDDMQALAKRISLQSQLAAEYIHHAFEYNDKLDKLIKVALITLTSGPFGKSQRAADYDQLSNIVHSLLQVRIAVSQATSK